MTMPKRKELKKESLNMPVITTESLLSKLPFTKVREILEAKQKLCFQ